MSCSCSDCGCQDDGEPIPIHKPPDANGRGEVRDVRTGEKLGEYQLPEGPEGEPMTPFRAYPARLTTRLPNPDAPEPGTSIVAEAMPNGSIYLRPHQSRVVFKTDATPGEDFVFE